MLASTMKHYGISKEQAESWLSSIPNPYTSPTTYQRNFRSRPQPVPPIQALPHIPLRSPARPYLAQSPYQHKSPTSISGGSLPTGNNVHIKIPHSNNSEGLGRPTAEKGSFDLSPKIETVPDEQAKVIPAQLLAEIRKHHNLTPGGAKGSSFSGSIPVTASERSKDDGRPKDLVGSLPTREEASSSGISALPNFNSKRKTCVVCRKRKLRWYVYSRSLFAPYQMSHEQ
jgi:hypothetical protein